MKKIVFSLFLIGTLFLNINNVFADESDDFTQCYDDCCTATNMTSDQCEDKCNYTVQSARNEKMETCINLCTSNSDMTESECKIWCAADIYTEVSNCTNGCGSAGRGESSCREGCLKTYLNKIEIKSNIMATYNDKMNLCINDCSNISMMSKSQCSSWCIAYLGEAGTDIDTDNDTDTGNTMGSRIQCGDFNIPTMFAEITSTVITLLTIVTPIIIVLLGSFDLVKATIAQKEDEMKKGQQTFIRRLIIGVLVFLVFAIVQVIIGVVAPRQSNQGMWNCVDCLVNGDCD